MAMGLIYSEMDSDWSRKRIFYVKSKFTDNIIQRIVHHSMNERQQFNKANSQLRVLVHDL